MNLIAITVPYFYRGESDDIVGLLIDGRFQRIHIRKPGAADNDMRELLNAIPAEFRGRISLHDCHGLAKEYGVGGVHLNGRNNTAPEGWSGLVSKSLHTVEELAEETEADYVFLSPIFPSISKPGYCGSLNPEELSGRIGNNVYALGGVTYDRLPILEAAGFRGAAMLGAVWRCKIDPEQFRLQFITHGKTSKEVIDGAKKALTGGCRWVQVRMKDFAIDEVEYVVSQLSSDCRSHGAILLVDDHVELAARLEDVDGVHVGRNDMPVSEARRMIGPKKILGATANKFEDVCSAANDGADYVGLGPYRFTTTKKNLSPILGVEGYENILSKCEDMNINIPVVAIGGIKDDDIPQIMATGVDGIAVSGTILKSENPIEKTRQLVNVIDKSIKQ